MRASNRRAAMDVVLHMNAGEGETSYAKNSLAQKSVLLKTKSILEEAVSRLCFTDMPRTLKIADLGCSTGPNSFVPATMIIDAIHENCIRLGSETPDFHVFLNDLPENDFNTLFKLIPTFKRGLAEKGGKFGSCFIAGSPGSFYERLFPDESMHLVYSGNSLHWLSKVPMGLDGEITILNKRNIALGRTSPPDVFKAYLDQFQRDFPSFLKLRAQEIVPKGCMVLSMLGRKLRDPSNKECYNFWDVLADALGDMAAEGVVEEAKLDSFNMPYYEPHIDELKDAIEEEGSFNMIQMQQHYLDINCKVLTKSTRAAVEPILSNHFGQDMMDELFKRFEEKLELGGTNTVFLALSLTRKG